MRQGSAAGQRFEQSVLHTSTDLLSPLTIYSTHPVKALQICVPRGRPYSGFQTALQICSKNGAPFPHATGVHAFLMQTHVLGVPGFLPHHPRSKYSELSR